MADIGDSTRRTEFADLSLAAILWRRVTLWRIRWITRRLSRQANYVERLWASMG